MKSALQFLLLLLIFQGCDHLEVLPAQNVRENSLSIRSKSAGSGHAFTLQPSPYEAFLLGFGTASPSAKIVVTWGDGQSTSYTLTSPYDYIDHNYVYGQSYTIEPFTITGELHKINYFSSYYGNGEFTSIDFSTLTHLREIDIGLTATPAMIDLSHNHKLRKVAIGFVRELNSLILPKSHSISNIDLYGPIGLDMRNIDAIIDNIYKNTSAKKIMGGTFVLYADCFEDCIGMIGPPSPGSIQKLRRLQDVYGWTIQPELP